MSILGVNGNGRKRKRQSCFSSEIKACCKVEAIINADERDQIVLPKELREKAGIRVGDKLAITSWEKDGKICCIALTKTEDLTNIVKATLGPVMKEILTEKHDNLQGEGA